MVPHDLLQSLPSVNDGFISLICPTCQMSISALDECRLLCMTGNALAQAVVSRVKCTVTVIPGLADVYDVGVLGSVLTLDQLADGRWKALTQIHRRVMIKDFVGEADGYVADVEVLDEQPAPDVPDLILMKTKAYFIAHSFRDTIKQGYPRGAANQAAV